MKIRKRFGATALVVLGAVSLSACSLAGNTHESAQAGATDYTSGQVAQMPSGFRNVAFKCVRLQGQWFIVASASDGGSSDDLAGAISVAPAPRCTHYGG
jgi:hypothetical protein